MLKIDIKKPVFLFNILKKMVLSVQKKALFLIITLLIFNFTIVMAEDNSDKSDKSDKEENSQKIIDNSFLIEEAYNQDPGEVQHIQTYQYDNIEKSWIYSFTQEWPLAGKKHQISYLIPIVHNTGDLEGTGIGDIAINYRYQLIDGDTIAMAPRFSLILPTGDYKEDFGTGAFGFQTNIPISIELGDTWMTHWNVGLTYTPGAKAPNDFKDNTVGFNYGASIIWLPSDNFNILVEAVGGSGEFFEIADTGFYQLSREDNFFLNPGMRFAINCDSGLQIVPGISFPIGLGPSNGDNSILLYLSFENQMFDPSPEEETSILPDLSAKEITHIKPSDFSNTTPETMTVQ